MTPEACPICGADVPARAKACPECGADEKTGWSEQARYDSLDLPDDSFDYDEFAAREFGDKSVERRSALDRKLAWKVVAALLVLGIGYLFIRRFL